MMNLDKYWGPSCFFEKAEVFQYGWSDEERRLTFQERLFHILDNTRLYVPNMLIF